MRAESAGSDPAHEVWPTVIEVMREVGIDLSGRRPRKLLVEMQLHADWAVTMGCGDVCPYVPSMVEAWDIPDPAGRPIDEVREIRDMVAEHVHRLIVERLDEIQADRSAHEWRLRKMLPTLIEEFEATALAGGDPRLRRRDPRPLRRRPRPLAHPRARQPRGPRLPRARALRRADRRLTREHRRRRCGAACSPSSSAPRSSPRS